MPEKKKQHFFKAGPREGLGKLDSTITSHQGFYPIEEEMADQATLDRQNRLIEIARLVSHQGLKLPNRLMKELKRLADGVCDERASTTFKQYITFLVDAELQRRRDAGDPDPLLDDACFAVGEKITASEKKNLSQERVREIYDESH